MAPMNLMKNCRSCKHKWETKALLQEYEIYHQLKHCANGLEMLLGSHDGIDGDSKSGDAEWISKIELEHGLLNLE